MNRSRIGRKRDQAIAVRSKDPTSDPLQRSSGGQIPPIEGHGRHQSQRSTTARDPYDLTKWLREPLRNGMGYGIGPGGDRHSAGAGLAINDPTARPDTVAMATTCERTFRTRWSSAIARNSGFRKVPGRWPANLSNESIALNQMSSSMLCLGASGRNRGVQAGPNLNDWTNAPTHPAQGRWHDP